MKKGLFVIYVMTNIKSTLKERGESYGEFIDNASIAQLLKQVVRMGEAYGELDFDQREAIDMICSKISREVTSPTIHVDNWTDMIGYATLVETRLKGEGLIENGIFEGIPIKDLVV